LAKSNAGQHQQEDRRVWRVEALPKTHENLTGGATFLDRSDSRSSLFYRELRTDDRVQDT